MSTWQQIFFGFYTYLCVSVHVWTKWFKMKTFLGFVLVYFCPFFFFLKKTKNKKNKVSSSLDWLQTQYVGEEGLKFLIFLPPPSRNQDYSVRHHAQLSISSSEKYFQAMNVAQSIKCLSKAVHTGPKFTVGPKMGRNPWPMTLLHLLLKGWPCLKKEGGKASP